MASPGVARGEESLRLSFEKEILGNGVPAPGLSRRDSSSTTGSGRPLPSGHWTVPISGNCPRCHHHHRSIKAHIKNAEGASVLVDVHCEKCNKLWIGPGSRNSTRISLASNETIDPPPMEPEARTALTQAIRSVTRVATLSPTLPDIQEGVAGLSREPSTRERTQEPAAPLVDQVSSTDLEPTSVSSATTPTTPFPERISKITTNGTNAARSRRLLSSLKRRLGNTRLGRLPLVTKLFGECNLNTVNCTEGPFQDSVAAPGVAPAQPINVPGPSSKEPKEASLAKEIGNVIADTPPAEAFEVRSSLGVVDQEAINVMSPEQRIAFLRAQITLSTQHSPHPEHSLRTSSHCDQDDLLDSLAILAANLLGIGNAFDQYNYMDNFRDSDSARQSLQISDTRTSEAATVVDGQTSAPDNLLREAIHRAYRLSGPARPPSMESNVDHSRRDVGVPRPSFESSITAGAHSINSARGGNANRRSRQSMGRTSTLFNEASASQPQLPTSEDMNTEPTQDNGRPTSPSPPRH